ncbi:hypothetical protein ACKFKF_09165 [Phormidesmis sp. 146-12]
MTSSPRPITVDLDANHPNLLNGLEAWLQLDLLTDRQVQSLSRLYLICALPDVLVAPVVREASSSSDPSEVAVTDFITTIPREQRSQPGPAPSNFLTRFMQSFMAELSVVWLLVLGVFMVIVSSAVLAASQWQNFPSVGQYLVLLAYTLSFWGVSTWAGRQENLRLTASTLQIIALLLVPVNFWAIDRFLLQSFQLQNGVTAAIAGLILTAITFPLFKSSLLSASAVEKTRSLLCYLGLSYLQSGWEFAQFPILAIYLAAVGLTIARPRSSSKLLSLLGFALALLLIRAVFIVGVDVAQLGLAFGICGWLTARFAQQTERSRRSWSLSSGLLGLGWLVSVGSVPWQALVVSAIGLWVCVERLRRFWRRFEVVGLVAIALQMSWLLWRLIPPTTQVQIVEFSTRLTETQGIPAALLGLILFPYVPITLALSEWLHQQQKPALEKLAARIALALGILFTGLSVFVPLTQTCNLFLSTVTLVCVTWRCRSRLAYDSLVHFTHLIGLFTILSAIHYWFPDLDQSHWAGVLLVFTIAEWVFSVTVQTVLQKSAWYVGFGFAAASYTLLLEKAPPILSTSWLVIPLALTGIAVRSSDRRRIAACVSTIALLAVQFLTLQSPETGLFSLGLAALLTVVNSRCLLQLEAAQIAIGFSLTFISWLLWHWVPGMREAESWLLVGAIATTLLWQLRGIFQTRTSQILALYETASDGWALFLCAGVLIGSTVHAIALYAALTSPSLVVLAAIFLVTAASTRTWQTRSELSFWVIGLGLELLVAESLAWAEPSIPYLSIINVGLGLATQVVGDRRQTNGFWVWHGLPLVYGSFALFLRLQTFESWTGMISLGVALIAIGVGRRLPTLKPLTYLGAIGISLSAYELLFYQIQALDWSDRLMAMATLGAVLMALYRWLFPLWSNYFRLSLAEVKQLAHLHWGMSSLILIGAAVLTLLVPTPGTLALIGFTTGMILSLYAIFQARRHPSLTTAEFWLYAGLLEAAGLAWYLSTKPWFSGIFSSIFRPYAGALTAIAAFLIFVTPWDRLGWAKRSWQRVSLAVPLLVLVGTAAIVQPLSLIVTGVFYSLVASIRREVRWTYLSVGLLNWLVLSQLNRLNVDLLFWQVLPIGVSTLYFAYIEPSFQQSDKHESRHYVRICGAGLICIVALFTQENYGILPGIVSLIAIFAGLGLKTRAFLYVGTAVFLLNVFNQLVILATVYSFLKWVIGLCIGILLIWVAANFETRRERVTTLMQNWLSQLQEWQ